MGKEITDRRAQDWIIRRIAQSKTADDEAIARARELLADGSHHLFLIDNKGVIIVRFAPGSMTIHWAGSWVPGLEVLGEYHPQVQEIALAEIKRRVA